MKNFKSFCFAILAVAFVSTSLTSCSKWKASRRLDGTWNVTSYTSDGVEYIGSFIDSFTITFTKDDKETGTATSTSVSSGYSSSSTSNYTIGDKAETLRFTYTDGSFEEYDMDLKKDEMTLTGNIDGYAYSIQGEKQ